MRKFIFILILSLTIKSFGQQSLLWEITGNNLQKPSYLYGTMHVSSKVAFRLDDVFYEVLNTSDCIALESDPSTWLENSYDEFSAELQNYESGYKNDFYSKIFKLNQPEETLISNSIRYNSNMINSYLYRKNSINDDFEEDTYLDMFIYQAGKKKKKSIISLENLDEVKYLTSKASYNINKKKADSWLTKLFEKENEYTLQEKVYRERNLDLLDSIGVASNTQFFREHMLYKRNKNMVRVLDSVLQHKTVFSGVGAAHLPGENGMINLLIEKGYSVKPLTSTETEYAKIEKNKLDELFTQPEYKLASTPDNFITINSFDKLREYAFNGFKYYIAPDMTNGAYLTISRIDTYEYFPNDDPITLEKIDNQLYENIPGDIIKKEKIESPFPGISILNKTKKGDYQKYHIYKTPLEIIIIKLGGKKDYVLQYESEIFNSISFKQNTDEMELFNSTYNKYSVELPKFNTSENINNVGKKLIQAYKGDDYYFLQETPVFDFNYIESDAFEAKYINERFFYDLKLKNSTHKKKNGLYDSYESKVTIDSITKKKVFLKSIVKNNSYYLLGFVGKDSSSANRYFKSFNFNKKINYTKGFIKTRDTALSFHVTTNIKPPLNYMSYAESKKESYEQSTKKASYLTKANEKINITRLKFHDLQMYENIDSLWNDYHGLNRYNYSYKSYNKFYKTNEKKWSKDDLNFYSYSLKDSTSAKMILVKKIQTEGVLYQLKTLIDSIEKPSDFLTQFYDTFTPLDSLKGKGVFSDKTPLFLKALKENDSITLDSYSKVVFKKSHIDEIIEILENHDETDDDIREYLISELIYLDLEKVTPFIKKTYINSFSEPEIQTHILEALLYNESKKSIDLFLTLFEYDLPLTDSKYYHFLTRNTSLELKKHLFPQILKYASIEEYKAPIYKALSKLKDSLVIKPKLYKKFVSQITNDGKIEIKRQLTKKNSRRKNSILDSYVKLLFPFKETNSVEGFFKNLEKSNDTQALATYYVLLEKFNYIIPEAVINKTINDPEKLWCTIEKLDQNNLLSKIKNKKITQEEYAKSKLFSSKKLDEDIVSFLKEVKITTDTGKAIIVYFYSLSSKGKYRDDLELYYIGFDISDGSEKIIVEPYHESRSSGFDIDDIDRIDTNIEDALEQIKHKTRKRVYVDYY